MISHKHKCIFVHIPKCGGSSIEDLLWPREKDRCEANLWMGFIDRYHNKYQTGGLQHLFSRHIRDEVGHEVFDSYYKFAIVRNPWDKAVSQYCYIKQREDLREYIGMKTTDSFEKYLSLIQLKSHVQWEPQWKFILDTTDQLLVDHIGRFENFNDEAKEILNHLNIADQEIPHRKKGTRGNYKDYYNPESIKTIKQMYQRDIEMFGYSFE